MSVLLRGGRRLLLMDMAASSSSSVLAGRPAANYNSNNQSVGGVGTRYLSVSKGQSNSVASGMAGSAGQLPPVTSAGGGDDGGAIRITDKCKRRLREILKEEGAFLRVSVEGGGCSGFQYKFNIDNQRNPDDIVISKDGGNGSATVVIDEISLDLVKGSTLDYETELIRSSFRIVANPHAEQGCSCGASFNMKI